MWDGVGKIEKDTDIYILERFWGALGAFKRKFGQFPPPPKKKKMLLNLCTLGKPTTFANFLPFSAKFSVLLILHIWNIPFRDNNFVHRPP